MIRVVQYERAARRRMRCNRTQRLADSVFRQIHTDTFPDVKRPFTFDKPDLSPTVDQAIFGEVHRAVRHMSGSFTEGFANAPSFVLLCRCGIDFNDPASSQQLSKAI